MNHNRSEQQHPAEIRQRKEMLENTWILALILSGSSVVIFWYLGLGQIDIAPILWTLALLGLMHVILKWRAQSGRSIEQVRWYAMASQAVGIVGMGLAWHLFGGIQQPMFPLFIMLPLLTGGLVLTFWQQQLSLLLFLGLLLSAALLSPDTNSFIAERYGLSLTATHWIPGWFPKSRIAFADVSTSPAYNLMLTGSLAILSIALSASARAIVALSWRLAESATVLRAELKDAQNLGAQLIARAPSSEVLVARNTGRILQASERFLQFLDRSTPATGEFLLDTVAFSYPTVVKRLLSHGGDEIQEATVRGRDVVLRLRGDVIDSQHADSVRLTIEVCDDLCWRSAMDSMSQPVFAVNARGNLLLLNRAATALFGLPGPGSAVSSLFDDASAMGRWWDIGPLESARRVLRRGGLQFTASIHRERIAQSVADLSFIQLQAHEPVHAVASA